LARTEAELEESIRVKDRLVKDVAEFQRQRDELDKTCRIQREEMDKFRLDLSRAKKISLERDIIDRRNQEKYNKLEARVDHLHKSVQSLTRLVQESETEKSSTLSILAELKNRNEALNQMLEESSRQFLTERDQMNNCIEKLELDRQARDLEKAGGRDDLDMLEFENAALRNQLDEQGNKIRSLEQKLMRNKESDRSLSGFCEQNFSKKQADGSSSENLNRNLSLKSNGTFEATRIVGNSDSGRGISSKYAMQDGSADTDSASDFEKTNNTTMLINMTQRKLPSQKDFLKCVDLAHASRGNCLICSKSAFGIMKSCKCASRCGFRAHRACLDGNDSAFCTNHIMEH